MEEGWRSSSVKLGVLARGVARSVNESGVQADSLLRAVLARIDCCLNALSLTTSAASLIGMVGVRSPVWIDRGGPWLTD